MKYYVYISESKIDMLHSQISQTTAVAKEASLGFDWKFLKGEIKTARGVPENKLTKLNDVVARLEKDSAVGSLDDAKPYIRGALRMKWASIGIIREFSPVTFWGYADSNSVLGLAGSAHHLVGTQREGFTHCYSQTPLILAWLKRELDLPKGDRKRLGIDKEWLNRAKHMRGGMIETSVEDMVRKMDGELEEFEFIAKVLHRSSVSQDLPRRVILATPLYVAMHDSDSTSEVTQSA